MVIIMSKETFKSFARLHPELANAVVSGSVTWQQLYELYEIYGENNKVWNSYFSSSTVDTISHSANTVKDLIHTLENLDMDSVQKGITNIQKTIGLLQDIGIGSRKDALPYEAKPIYQKFED